MATGPITCITSPNTPAMKPNVIFFAWNRPVPGREQTSGEHFQEFVQYLIGLQQDGKIDAFQPVLLDVHGGDMNGFFLISGSTDQLLALASSEEWITHMTRAAIHLNGAGAVFGATGDALSQRMDLWSSLAFG
jgi:hypothetical protein